MAGAPPSSAGTRQEAALWLQPRGRRGSTAAWINGGFLEFVASELVPIFVLNRMPGYTRGAVATTRVIRFCPAMIRIRTADGPVPRFCKAVVNGYFCDRCAQRYYRISGATPPPIRLLYVWWSGMPEAAPPLRLALVDVVDPSQQRDKTLSQQLRMREDPEAGRVSEKTLRIGEKDFTRITFTGEIAQTLWARMCMLGAQGVGRRGRPREPRSSTG